MIEFQSKYNTDEELYDLLHPFVRQWFKEKFGTFCLSQKYAVMDIHSRNNVLVSASTGSGKTLTAFLSILNELVDSSEKGILLDKTYAVYISPLKALGSDVFVNLIKPLEEIENIAGKKLGIRIAVRTGDTTSAEKQKMLKNAPHIIVTTPESLALMLSSIKFKNHLSNVDWFVADEIHALAENKRGVHLSLSMERLQRLSPGLCRIGLSATISPLEEVAKYLVGSERPCKIVNLQNIKEMDLKVLSPVPDLISESYEKINKKTYELINELIQQHKTTLIFTNTRAGTERVVHSLKTMFPKDYYEIYEGPPTTVASLIGAHHGSLSKDHRFMIEDSLRQGKLKAVCCSTSLELGIDIGHIDLVICLGSPKSVSRFLQRCLPYDAEVLLEDGSYVKVGDIVENKISKKVIAYNSKKGFVSRKIVNYHKYFDDKFIEIKLRSGEKIICTEDHPLLTKEGWKNANKVKEEDKIGQVLDEIKFNYKIRYLYKFLPKEKIFVYNCNDYFIKLIDNYLLKNNISLRKFSEIVNIPYSRLIDVRRKNGRKKSILLDYYIKVCKICNIAEEEFVKNLSYLKYKGRSWCELPIKLSQELLWLTGLIASDGCIIKSIDKRFGSYYFIVKFSNKDKKLINKVKKLLNSLKISYYYSLRNDGLYTLEIGNNVLAYLLIGLGIPFKNKSSSIVLTNSIFKLDNSLIYAFLEGVFEGDGNYSKKYPSLRIFSGSKKFIEGLHRLFSRLGYHSHILSHKAKQSKIIQKINLNKLYYVVLTRNNDIERFFENIPKFGTKAKNSYDLVKNFENHHYKKSLISKYIHWEDVISIEKLKSKKQSVYNLTIEGDSNFIVGNIVTHNCGRAGHQLHSKVKSRIIVTDRDDLVECSVLLKHAIEKKIDSIHIPKNALDVLAQQIFGMSLEEDWDVGELYKTIKKSYCYESLESKDFHEILDYLSGEYTSLEDRHVYAKIWHNRDVNKIGRKGRMSRVIYMTNIGTIPDQHGVTVKIGTQQIGSIDEAFLEKLKRGDRFVLGGDVYEFKYARGMVAQVGAASGRKPTVPSWFSEMLPLSFDLAMGIQRFRKLMNERLVKGRKKSEIIEFINDHLYVDDNGAEAIYNYFNQQFKFIGVPNEKEILVEDYFDDDEQKHYVVFHALYGRRVNDALARAVAYAIGRSQHRSVEMGIRDNGFYIGYNKGINVMPAVKLIKTNELRKVLELAIEQSEILKRRFRHCAGRALMILRNYKGKTKRVGRQQVSSMILLSAVRRISENFPILKEARREVLEDLMDVKNTIKVFNEIEAGRVKFREAETFIPSPFSFNIVAEGYTDILKLEDKQEFIRRLHQLVLVKIGKKG